MFGSAAVIEEFLERTVTPGGELKIAGTAQNDALDSIIQNFGSLDPALPAEALILTNAYALNTIYFSCGGAAWAVGTNWNTASSPCDPLMPWFGVSCEPTGMITNLTLARNDAVGNLPSEIRALSSLSKLHCKKGRMSSQLRNIFAT